MNSVNLLGRLTIDPTITYTQGETQTCVAKITLAVDRRFKKPGEPEADFIRCICFGKSAEAIEKYVIKGTKIAVHGKINTGSYTNKEGQKIYTTDVIIDEWEFAESKKADSGQADNSRPAPSNAVGDGFMNIPDGIDSELPFN